MLSHLQKCLDHLKGYKTNGWEVSLVKCLNFAVKIGFYYYWRDLMIREVAQVQVSPVGYAFAKVG